MAAKLKDIENTRQTVSGLCRMAGKLGYTDGNYGSGPLLSDGSDVGHLLSFFDDNPGAIEAVVEWVIDYYDLDDDEDSEDEDEEESDEEESELG